MLSIDELNEIHLDVLREIGNIGAGNAATSLSQMLNAEVNMSVPKVRILDISARRPGKPRDWDSD